MDLIILKDIIKFQEGLKSNVNIENKFYNMAMVEKNWIRELKNKYLYSNYLEEIKKFLVIILIFRVYQENI